MATEVRRSRLSTRPSSRSLSARGGSRQRRSQRSSTRSGASPAHGIVRDRVDAEADRRSSGKPHGFPTERPGVTEDGCEREKDGRARVTEKREVAKGTLLVLFDLLREEVE